MTLQNIPTPNTTIKTTFTDSTGKEINSFTWAEKTSIDANGSINTEKTTVNQILADDLCYNPSMSMGNNPVRLAACFFCRNSATPTNPLISVERAKICYNCLRTACPTHIRRSPIDKQFRCKSCNRKHRIKHLLKIIFFAEEEL